MGSGCHCWCYSLLGFVGCEVSIRWREKMGGVQEKVVVQEMVGVLVNSGSTVASFCFNKRLRL